jgi:hypothetical protein
MLNRTDDGEFSIPPAEESAAEPHVYCLAVRVVLACALAAFAGYIFFLAEANRSWLFEENRRIEPWEIPIVWSSELASMLFLFRYCAATVIPRLGIRAPSSRWTIRVFLVSAALDASVSLYGLVSDRIAYTRAIKTCAQTVAGHTFIQWTGHRRYSFTVAFRDQAGRDRVAFYSLLERDLPMPVREGIDKGKLPLDLPILYDPSWSSRSWPAWTAYSDDNRLAIFSLLTLMMSGLLSALLGQLRGHFPGLPPPEVGPFLAALFFLSMVAMLQGW